MSSEIRLGVVGCGRILNAHLRGLKTLQEAGYTDFRVTALCARQEVDLHRFKKRGEGPGPRPAPVPNPNDPLNAPHMYISDLHPDSEPELYTDYREMLKSGSIDAVLVLTGHDNHHSIAIDAMRSGKHVVVEKPMAISVKAGKRMCEVAQETERVLGVLENAYYAPQTQASAWMVGQGAIGDVLMVYQSAIGGRTFRPDLVSARTPWRQSKLKAGGGASIDLGVHFFNRIRTIAGPVKSVSAVWKTLLPARVLMDAGDERVMDTVENEVDDGFFANFLLGNGAIGHLTSVKACPGVVLSFPGGLNVWGSTAALSDGKIVSDGTPELKVLDHFHKAAPQALKERVIPKGIEDAFALEQLDFLQSIQNGQSMRMDGEEGLIDLALSYAILESGVLNRPVTLSEMMSGIAETYQQSINQYYAL